jgi:hypothetical protein
MSEIFKLIPEWLQGAAGILVFLGIVSFVFFGIWRLVSGHFITNLVMTIELERTAKNERRPTPIDDLDDDNADDLVTIIKLKKGIWSALTLHELYVEIFALNGKGERVSKDPVGRYSTDAFDTPEKGRTLNLTPNEETQYSIYCPIKSGVVYEVKVTLKGERYKTALIRDAQKKICAWLYKHHRRKQPDPTKVFHTASAVAVRAKREAESKRGGL